MSDDDNDGQMIFGDLVGLKLPDICLTGEEKPRKNLTQETCPDQGLNPGPRHDRRTCCRLAHSGGLLSSLSVTKTCKEGHNIIWVDFSLVATIFYLHTY